MASLANTTPAPLAKHLCGFARICALLDFQQQRDSLPSDVDKRCQNVDNILERKTYSNTMAKNQQRTTLVLLFVSACTQAYPSTNSYRDLDICNHWNGRRHFLELGERGELHARNVTTTAFRSTVFTPNSPNGNAKNRSAVVNDIWYQCNLELVTCAECVIRITFTHANFSKTCASNGVGKSSLCPCEHIQFSEPPYDTTISGQEFCGDGKVFRSKTRTLLLKFFYRATNSHVFSLQYFSERNVKIISGSPRQTINGNGNVQNVPEIISTPYFPMAYPRDYCIEHILTCEADNCQVRLDFTDFQLGLTSTLEIFDSNGQMLDSYTGEHFRPPITVSSGKSLLLQFRGNAATGVGFRAEVSFVSSKQLKDERLVPYTDCGGMVSGPGGAITMMNMIENATDIRLFDCIWIIKPGNNYMMMKTHISLRVDEFHGMAARSDLSIRQGTTSDALEIENVVWPNNGMSMESHTVPILTGYYIRLRGVFGMTSKLAIVYSVFNYLNCYIGSEFLCGNNHCISIRLHCDGFDHCGDGSDEPESCEDDWAHLQNDRRWYSHKPNYYFPKIEQYPDLKTATGIFIISTLGIFGVLSGWMVILYRMGVRARHQRELQNHLQTISELLDRQEDERTPDEPPSYEAPPDYEEVIKIGMEQELREPRGGGGGGGGHRHGRRHQRRRRERSCSRAASNCTVQSTLPLQHSCSLDRPSTSAAAMTHAVASTDTTQDTCKLQELSNRVLMATAICGAAEPSGTTATTGSDVTTARSKSVGLATSPTSLSVGCELSANIAAEPTQSNGSNAATTNEDTGTDVYRDDSLNISLTLGMPSSSATSTPNYSNEHEVAHTNTSSKSNTNKTNCTEQTYLKRSWILVNHDARQPFKVQRLRHTFSSPEPFNANELQLPYPDFLSYGTILPHDRSFMHSSNASNFGSELSRDPSTSDSSFGKQRQTVLAGNETVASSTEATTLTDGHSVINSSQTLQTNLTMDSDCQQRQQLLCSETDSDAENKISCFGAVAQRRQQRAAGTNKNRRRQGHTRSRSFTNAGVAQQRSAAAGRLFKRSSSADLLMNYSPFKFGRAANSPQNTTASSSSTGSAAEKMFLI